MQTSRAETGERNDPLGLALVLSAVVVIALMVSLYVDSQIETRVARNRADGSSLASVLSRVRFDELAPTNGTSGPLETVRTNQSNPSFAYAAVVAPDGRVLHQVSAPDVSLAGEAPPFEPADWVGERTVSAGGRSFQEHLAPVIRDEERIAHVRVGFVEPDATILFEKVSLLGRMALPVFLLVPFALFGARRMLRPLSAASDELDRLASEQRFDRLQTGASGTLGAFLERCNRFVDIARERVDELESRKTEVVASSKVLAYQKSRVEAVLETLPDATLVLDEMGSVVFANAKVEPVLGVSLDEMRSSTLEAWCSDPRLLALLAKFTGRDGAQSLGESVELAGERPTDPVLVVEARPLARRGSEDVRGALVVARDVTLESVARRAQGEFVSHVAHELKSPLNVMSMYSESLLERGDDAEFRIEASNVIQDEVERLSGLISTLLSIARIESGAVTIERQRVRLRDFLEDAIEAVSRAARDRELEFHLDVPNDARNIQVDKDLFRVALNNLLTNAIKYNRVGGEVRVSVREADDRLSIQVADTGIGMSEDDLPHVFDKFFRSSDPDAEKRGGHGLGLSLAQEIVELHGGRIRVQTSPGEGSEFSIELRTRNEDRD